MSTRTSRKARLRRTTCGRDLSSDHLPFRQLGLPAVLVSDTGPLRFPHRHGSEDLPDRLDYERTGGVVRGVHGVLAVEDRR